MRDKAQTITPGILPLSVEDLGFESDGKPLLREVTFTLPKGGITIIMGHNGAGKSLLLRICHGLLTPVTGAVRWLGDGARQPVGSRRHSMVFQRPVMLRRSARANIAHALGAHGIADPSSKVDEALARFGLADLAHCPARLMSGGEQQRLAIARAWALSPEMLFLDEPSSQLDPGATRQIEAMITELAEEGMTILMSTHDLGQARRLARRILFLHKGRLVEDAPSAVFFASAATAEARAFIAGDLLW